MLPKRVSLCKTTLSQFQFYDHKFFSKRCGGGEEIALVALRMCVVSTMRGRQQSWRCRRGSSCFWQVLCNPLPPTQIPNWNNNNYSFISLDQLKMYFFLLIFYSLEKDSPVFYKPEILTFRRAVAHNQDSMIYELWVAVWNVVQT